MHSGMGSSALWLMLLLGAYHYETPVCRLCATYRARGEQKQGGF
jgi:hypothetical protein